MTLARRYGYTPSQISDMTPYQQSALYYADSADSDTISFDTVDQYLKWLTTR